MLARSRRFNALSIARNPIIVRYLGISESTDTKTNISPPRPEIHTEPSMKIDPYLYFNGNCSEAMEFYIRCLNGKVMNTVYYKDGPMKDQVEPKDLGKILHAAILIGDSNRPTKIMFSDIVPSSKSWNSDSSKHIVGNNVHLSLEMDCYDKLTTIWKKFQENKATKVTMSLKKQFWGQWFGQLIDPYGVRWMFSVAHVEDDIRLEE
jgi:PhnB protein